MLSARRRDSRQGTAGTARRNRKDKTMAKRKRGPREPIVLVSSAGTGTQYFTSKNKRNTDGKLELKKYDKKARKHVLFKEGKKVG